MLGRKLLSTRAVIATLVTVALMGGCREATTGPSDQQSSSFASAIKLVSGNAQAAAEGATLAQTLTVKVIDVGGLPVRGATVTFAVKSGGGSIVPPSNTTDIGGLATATWTLGNSLGAQTAVARLTGSFISDSVTFNATATVGPAGTVVIIGGNNQLSTVGKPLALPLIVKVTDGFGNNVSGTTVTWAPGGLSGSVTPTHDTTSADGTASTSWTVGNTATTQTVTATVAGLAPITFSAITAADTGRIITLVPGSTPPATAAEEAVLPNISVKVTDQFGNPIVGDVIVWNDLIIGGGTVSAAQSSTDATGTATSQWTLGTHTGVQTLRIREGSSANTLTFNTTATIQFSDVFAGDFQACGIVAANNRVYCWGAGDAGQLGNGVLLSQNNPTTAIPQSGDTLKGPFLQTRGMSGGRDNFCALTAARQLYCWGRYLGGGPISVATFEDIKDGSGQELFPNFSALGTDFGCALDLAGIGFCTGQNYSGQLGNGTLVSPSPPNYSFIAPGPGQPSFRLFSTLSAGRTHACGMPRFNPNAAVVSRTPVCWGLNGSGQTGRGTQEFSDTIPTPITLPPGVTAFDSASLVTGALHTCAVAAAPAGVVGAAYCWGDNGFGQIGSGAAGTVNLNATAVSGGLVFGKLYAGEFHTCGLDANGVAYCWGRDDYGQLGDASSGVGNVKTAPVAVGGGLVFRSLSIGELYTCGVVGPPLIPGSPSQSAGTIYCWGDNSRGQLGNGSASNNAPQLTPKKVQFQP